jgi:CobQ-like glutamine amidotransferase family enzyme
MLARKQELNITWLYPKEMSTYGDRGNILTLRKRCEWRDIKVEIKEVGLGEKMPEDWTDLYFFGVGQDVAQTLVAEDLKSKKRYLQDEATSGKVFLGVCGGYQLFGIYYRDFEGKDIEGLEILDLATRASKKRMMGNMVMETDFLKDRLVGFENHSGQTRLGQKAKPLGRVIVGFGNNGEDKTEGAYQNNTFGSYLHGPLLPKNPEFADYLIRLALQKKFGEVELEFLNDTLEFATHETAVRRAKRAH